MKKIALSKKIILLLTVILAVALTMSMAAKHKISADAAEVSFENQVRLIRVQGTGEVFCEPDIAFVNFGVETTKTELTAAQSANGRTMSAIMASLKALGFNEDDIQTSNFSINPRYEYYNGISKKTGYQVNNTIRVKISDLGNAGKLIDTVTAAGANFFYGIEFGLTEKSEYYNAALRKALSFAQEKARLIADSQNVGLGSLISVIEQSSNGMYSYAREGRVMAMSDSSSGSTNISSGKMSIKAAVEVTYSVA